MGIKALSLHSPFLCLPAFPIYHRDPVRLRSICFQYFYPYFFIRHGGPLNVPGLLYPDCLRKRPRIPWRNTGFFHDIGSRDHAPEHIRLPPGHLPFRRILGRPLPGYPQIRNDPELPVPVPDGFSVPFCLWISHIIKCFRLSYGIGSLMVLLQQVVIPEIQIIPIPVINRLALFVCFPIDRIVTHHPIRVIKRLQPFLQFSCLRIPGSRKIRIFCSGVDLSGTSGEDLFPGDPVPIWIIKGDHRPYKIVGFFLSKGTSSGFFHISQPRVWIHTGIPLHLLVQMVDLCSRIHGQKRLCPRVIDQTGQIPSGQLKERLSALECVNRPGIRSDPYFFPISSKPVYDPILSCLQYLKIPQIVEQYRGIIPLLLL